MSIHSNKQMPSKSENKNKEISTESVQSLHYPKFDNFFCSSAINNCMQEFKIESKQDFNFFGKLSNEPLFVCKDHPKKRLKYICKTDNKLFCS